MSGTFLDKILEKRRVRVEQARERRSLSEIIRLAAEAPAVRPVSFDGAAPHIIAEVKKASPSKGMLREDFRPAEIARGYAAAGAVAISVLTEEDFFLGSLAHLEEVRKAVDTPILRKDFIFDPYQLYEARAAGADLYLLIMAMLEDSQAAELKSVGDSLGMTGLVEVHDAGEAERALKIEPELLGINNRNLRTFVTSIDVTLNLLPGLPEKVRVVSESGLSNIADIGKLRAAGVDTFLIGESFMRAEDPGLALAELRKAT